MRDAHQENTTGGQKEDGRSRRVARNHVRTYLTTHVHIFLLASESSERASKTNPGKGEGWKGRTAAKACCCPIRARRRAGRRPSSAGCHPAQHAVRAHASTTAPRGPAARPPPRLLIGIAEVDDDVQQWCIQRARAPIRGTPSAAATSRASPSQQPTAGKQARVASMRTSRWGEGDDEHG